MFLRDKLVISNTEEYLKFLEGGFIGEEDKLGGNHTVFMVEQWRRSPHEILVTKPDKSCTRFRERARAAEFVNMSPISFEQKLKENNYEFLVTLSDLKTCRLLPRVSPGDIIEYAFTKQAYDGDVSVKEWNMTEDKSDFYHSNDEFEFSSESTQVGF